MPGPPCEQRIVVFILRNENTVFVILLILDLVLQISFLVFLPRLNTAEYIAYCPKMTISDI